MIRLGEFEYCGKVKLTDVDGKVYVGEAMEITDAEDRSDLEEQEDGITLEIDGMYIEFLISEITSIEKL